MSKMEIKSEETAEKYVLVGVCRCCFQDGELKPLWNENICDGIKEVYGEMVAECFSLPWYQLEETDDVYEQICDTCVTRIRDAFKFKKLILQTEQQMKDYVMNAMDTQSTQDDIKTAESVFVKIESNSDAEQGDDNTTEDAGTVEYNTTEDIFQDDPKDSDFEVEYLMEDDDDVDLSLPPPARPAVTPPPVVRAGWPRKRRNAGIKKPYRQYTRAQFRQALEAVRGGRMTRLEAAETYRVPRKTLAMYLKQIAEADSMEVYPNEEDKDRMFKLIEEIQKILMYTNATPYKTTTTLFACAYCSAEGKTDYGESRFEEFEALRTHTRLRHAADRTTGVEQFMRPHWCNEVLKLDIYNLTCTICCTAIAGWNEMFAHLEESHSIAFDEAYTRVIPYVLGDSVDQMCALCLEPHKNYHHLDKHMNTHYNNYICQECGATFVASSRLKKHNQVHATGKYPCEACGKVFRLEKYRKKHHMLIHTKQTKVKCMYCKEKFHNPFLRHLHIVEAHKEKVKYSTCEYCGKVFDWKPYYITHLKKKHSQTNKYKCGKCSEQFSSHDELKEHRLKHKGQKTLNLCKICHKTYSTPMYLQQHIWHSHETVVKKILQIQDQDVEN